MCLRGVLRFMMGLRFDNGSGFAWFANHRSMQNLRGDHVGGDAQFHVGSNRTCTEDYEQNHNLNKRPK